MTNLQFTPNQQFFKKVAVGYKQEVRNNPSLRQAISLPARWNFHKVKIYLTRAQKTAFQIALSQMTKKQVKQQIKILQDMENEKVKQAKKFDKKLIAVPNDEKQAQECYKWAFYCREAAKFAEVYLQSLAYQKKI